MHFVKLIIVAIALELLACLGFISQQDKSVKVVQDKEIKEQIITIHKEQVINSCDSIL
ncbi:MAG: hypothetical protein KAR09_09105 [Bacteroidales bacterium]|nr:hypothetical protein [Bacteroidales bacterium]MCK5337761.1 hypothetical protein [Bacteroidales bacterium]